MLNTVSKFLLMLDLLQMKSFNLTDKNTFEMRVQEHKSKRKLANKKSKATYSQILKQVHIFENQKSFYILEPYF